MSKNKFKQEQVEIPVTEQVEEIVVTPKKEWKYVTKYLSCLGEYGPKYVSREYIDN